MLRHLNHTPRIMAALLATAVLALTGCTANDAPEGTTTSPGRTIRPTPTSPGRTIRPTPTSPGRTARPTLTSPGRTPTSPATTGTGAGRAIIVVATLTEFKITLSRTSFSPGRYTFVAEQRGQEPHALTINGPGVDNVTTPTIQPGGPDQQLTVTLQRGTYDLWCPVDDHRARGMEVTITVQ